MLLGPQSWVKNAMVSLDQKVEVSIVNFVIGTVLRLFLLWYSVLVLKKGIAGIYIAESITFSVQYLTQLVILMVVREYKFVGVLE